MTAVMMTATFSFSDHISTKQNDDAQVELEKVKKLCARHKTLCDAFNKWKLRTEQNDAQLSILSETGRALKYRHQSIQDSIRTADSHSLKRLKAEIASIDSQVDIWFKELTEINHKRTQLDMEFVALKAQLRQSYTHIQIASIDFERLERHHRIVWRQFLEESEAIDSRRSLMVT